LHRRASVADDSDLLARQTDIVVPAAAVPAVTLEDSTTGKFRCILRVEEASYGGNDDPRPFLRLYLPSGSGIGDFDAVDFVFAIPFALVNEFVKPCLRTKFGSLSSVLGSEDSQQPSL